MLSFILNSFLCFPKSNHSFSVLKITANIPTDFAGLGVEQDYIIYSKTNDHINISKKISFSIYVYKVNPL